jgi:hypothetical protein
LAKHNNKACRFHLGQAWYRKIQNLWLSKEYKDPESDNNFQIYSNMWTRINKVLKYVNIGNLILVRQKKEHTRYILTVLVSMDCIKLVEKHRAILESSIKSHSKICLHSLRNLQKSSTLVRIERWQCICTHSRQEIARLRTIHLYFSVVYIDRSCKHGLYKVGRKA